MTEDSFSARTASNMALTAGNLTDRDQLTEAIGTGLGAVAMALLDLANAVREARE